MPIIGRPFQCIAMDVVGPPVLIALNEENLATATCIKVMVSFLCKNITFMTVHGCMLLSHSYEKERSKKLSCFNNRR